MKKFLICLIGFLLTAFIGVAQISDKVNSKPEDLKQMKTRILLVALYKGDEAHVKIVEAYNTMVQKAVKEHWTINKDIEFKPIEEIAKLIEKKDTKYVLLLRNELRDMGLFGEKVMGGGDDFPILQYQRCEKESKKRDQFIYLPNSGAREDRCLTEGDLIFSVKYLQECIEYSIKNDKTVKIMDYFKDKAELVCDSKLQSKTILVDVKYRNKDLTDEDLNKAYPGKLVFASTKEIEDAILFKSTDKYVSMFCLWGMAKDDRTQTAYKLCLRVIFDPSTFEVVYCYEPGMMDAFDKTGNTVDKRDLKLMSKCKLK